MNLSVSEQALDWFQKEFDLDKQATIRLFPRYGGLGQKHKGYSVGIAVENPVEIGISFNKANRTFYVELVDVWFFEDCIIDLDVNRELDELNILIKEKV